MRLIDADALMTELNDTKYAWQTYDEVEGALRNIPTIEAEPVRHGRWDKRGQEIYCSECGEESGYTWAGASRYSDYCLNCGAKMDGGQNNER